MALTTTCGDCANSTGRCWRHSNISVVDAAATMTGDCPRHAYGQHSWLPWLRLDNGSFVTRCVRCQRTEQWHG